MTPVDLFEKLPKGLFQSYLDMNFVTGVDEWLGIFVVVACVGLLLKPFIDYFKDEDSRKQTVRKVLSAGIVFKCECQPITWQNGITFLHLQILNRKSFLCLKIIQSS